MVEMKRPLGDTEPSTVSSYLSADCVRPQHSVHVQYKRLSSNPVDVNDAFVNGCVRCTHHLLPTLAPSARIILPLELCRSVSGATMGQGFDLEKVQGNGDWAVECHKALRPAGTGGLDCGFDQAPRANTGAFASYSECVRLDYATD